MLHNSLPGQHPQCSNSNTRQHCTHTHTQSSICSLPLIHPITFMSFRDGGLITGLTSVGNQNIWRTHIILCTWIKLQGVWTHSFYCVNWCSWREEVKFDYKIRIPISVVGFLCGISWIYRIWIVWYIFLFSCRCSSWSKANRQTFLCNTK